LPFEVNHLGVNLANGALGKNCNDMMQRTSGVDTGLSLGEVTTEKGIGEFSCDTTANIYASKGILRILEEVGWSDSPDFACEAQGSHRNYGDVDSYGAFHLT
jgi:hypothetical protein